MPLTTRLCEKNLQDIVSGRRLWSPRPISPIAEFPPQSSSPRKQRRACSSAAIAPNNVEALAAWGQLAHLVRLQPDYRHSLVWPLRSPLPEDDGELSLGARFCVQFRNYIKPRLHAAVEAPRRGFSSTPIWPLDAECDKLRLEVAFSVRVIGNKSCEILPLFVAAFV